MLGIIARWLVTFLGGRLFKLLEERRVRNMAQELISKYATKAITNSEKHVFAVAELVERANDKLGIKIDTWDANAIITAACAGMKEHLLALESRAKVEIDERFDKVEEQVKAQFANLSDRLIAKADELEQAKQKQLRRILGEAETAELTPEGGDDNE